MAEVTPLKTVISEAVNNTTGPEVTKADANKIATSAAAEIKSDPVLTNALNQEPWWQSGVGFFGTGGVLWSLGFLIAQMSEHGGDFLAYDRETSLAALGALGGFGMVLYRRFRPGLKPMFSWGK